MQKTQYMLFSLRKNHTHSFPKICCQLIWQLPAAAGPAGLSAPLGAQPPDAARGRGLADLRRCHVSAAAGAASGFHLGDVELWPELRRQQGPETALLLAAMEAAVEVTAERDSPPAGVSRALRPPVLRQPG